MTQQPEDFVPNPPGVSNLDMPAGTLKIAPDDDALDDTGDGGMSEDEALAFMARPIPPFKGGSGA